MISPAYLATRDSKFCYSIGVLMFIVHPDFLLFSATSSPNAAEISATSKEMTMIPSKPAFDSRTFPIVAIEYGAHLGSRACIRIEFGGVEQHSGGECQVELCTEKSARCIFINTMSCTTPSIRCPKILGVREHEDGRGACNDALDNSYQTSSCIVLILNVKNFAFACTSSCSLALAGRVVSDLSSACVRGDMPLCLIRRSLRIIRRRGAGGFLVSV